MASIHTDAAHRPHCSFTDPGMLVGNGQELGGMPSQPGFDRHYIHRRPQQRAGLSTNFVIADHHTDRYTS